eukprot:c25397_g1_i1 orf=64-2406(-)
MDMLILLVSLLAAASISSMSALSDGASLLAAKAAWKLDQSWWQGDDPCKGWERVQCDDSQRVSSLNLSNVGIVGPIPSEISNLDHLTLLDLSNALNSKPPHNRISGDLSPLVPLKSLSYLNLGFSLMQSNTFPVAIFNLTNLTNLRIDNNRISGPVPKELAGLSNLTLLYLGNNNLSGPLPKEFGNLANLQELSMLHNNLQSTIPSEFGKLKSLTHLNLHDCNLYGGLPKEMGNLKNLKYISLYNNLLTGTIPDTWSNLTNLHSLDLHMNYFTKPIPPWLLQLPKLSNLNIGYNLFYGGLNLENVNISNLSVTCNFLTGPAPTRLALNSTGNCFDGSNSDPRRKCAQSYYSCDDFLQGVSNGRCPNCPPKQVLSDPATCVCMLSPPTGGSSSHGEAKTIGSVVGVGAFIVFVLGIWWIWSGKRSKLTRELWECPEGVQRFLYRDLSRATNNFSSSHEIGAGGFGKVFGGVVDGKRVAIKKAHSSSIQSSSGFRNEVILLSRLHHRNLVHLLGFCEEDGIQILVYEYMPNGNLQTLLFRNRSNIELDWLKRLDIAIGVAQGLDYLHSFADPPVIHRDVKPSNVLLDDNLVAKLSDFGISRVAPECETQFCTKPAGTVGYIDPQYILREQLTTASDVYSFGMVLLELITGQKSIDNTREDDRNLVEWAKNKVRTEGLKCIIDPELGDDYPEKVYSDMVRLAIDCASIDSESRPSMKVVVSILDACRWSVAPHVLEGTEDALDSFGGDEDDNDFKRRKSQRPLVKDGESSFAGESSVSLPSPR